MSATTNGLFIGLGAAALGSAVAAIYAARQYRASAAPDADSLPPPPASQLSAAATVPGSLRTQAFA